MSPLLTFTALIMPEKIFILNSRDKADIDMMFLKGRGHTHQLICINRMVPTVNDTKIDTLLCSQRNVGIKVTKRNIYVL